MDFVSMDAAFEVQQPSYSICCGEFCDQFYICVINSAQLLGHLKLCPYKLDSVCKISVHIVLVFLKKKNS
jgi:hypothetical protein